MRLRRVISRKVVLAELSISKKNTDAVLLCGLGRLALYCSASNVEESFRSRVLESSLSPSRSGAEVSSSIAATSL